MKYEMHGIQASKCKTNNINKWNQKFCQSVVSHEKQITLK